MRFDQVREGWIAEVRWADHGGRTALPAFDRVVLLFCEEHADDIQVFLGMTITMYYGEHHPVPHFHVRYGEHKASIAISSGALLAGRLPARVLALAVEWAAEHEAELIDNWTRAQNDQPLERIEPLV